MRFNVKIPYNVYNFITVELVEMCPYDTDTYNCYKRKGNYSAHCGPQST